MKLNWNFLEGAGVQNKRPSMGGVWIFSGTAHYTSATMSFSPHYLAVLKIHPLLLSCYSLYFNKIETKFKMLLF